MAQNYYSLRMSICLITHSLSYNPFQAPTITSVSSAKSATLPRRRTILPSSFSSLSKVGSDFYLLTALVSPSTPSPCILSISRNKGRAPFLIWKNTPAISLHLHWLLLPFSPFLSLSSPFSKWSPPVFATCLCFATFAEISRYFRHIH